MKKELLKKAIWALVEENNELKEENKLTKQSNANYRQYYNLYLDKSNELEEEIETEKNMKYVFAFISICSLIEHIIDIMINH